MLKALTFVTLERISLAEGIYLNDEPQQEHLAMEDIYYYYAKRCKIGAVISLAIYSHLKTLHFRFF